MLAVMFASSSSEGALQLTTPCAASAAAVEICAAPAIWQRYVEYAQEMYPLPGDDDDSDGDSAGAGAGACALTPQVYTGINVVRSVLEQAVSALGSHFKEGAAVRV